MESLELGFQALMPTWTNTNAAVPASLQSYNGNSIELLPRSIGVEYPLQQEFWPAILITFEPTLIRDYGLNPFNYNLPEGADQVEKTMQVYFEGYWDFEILSETSQERDRIADTMINMFMLNEVSLGSSAFYNKLNNYDLCAITLLPSTVKPVGSAIGPGTPWNEELLTYERTIRMNGIGAAFNSYSFNDDILKTIILKGTDAYKNERDMTIE